TNLPMLLVKLKQDESRPYAYPTFQNVVVSEIKLTVSVEHVKSLAASNDFGPLDTSKPFQPFGVSPVTGSSLIIGSKEIFQKKLSSAWFSMDWLINPVVYPTTKALPDVAFYFLSAGSWWYSSNTPVSDIRYDLETDLDKPVLEAPDFTPSA